MPLGINLLYLPLGICSVKNILMLIFFSVVINFSIRVTMDPAFLAIMRFPLKKVRLVFLFLKNHFLENGLESPLIFVFILKGKTK